MYLRRCGPKQTREQRTYWQLVESHRTERGPRQRVVAYLGDMDEKERLGLLDTASNRSGVFQYQLFDEDLQPEWATVNTAKLRVERACDFGGYWLGLEILHQLGLTEFLEGVMDEGQEEISWPAMALVLVLMRLCQPSSELRIAEHLYERSALGDLLGIPREKVNDDRLYRALDMLLPHKASLEKHLKERLGELFALDYDLLLYDMTSTYFEGQAEGNELARYGYSRDHRGDCKQVTMALVVSRGGMPLGYEVFAGNRNDVLTVEEMVEKIETAYGRAERIWVMDRGMVSEENLEYLREGGRRYIVGTPRSELRKHERELLDSQGWQAIREGLEVKLCSGEDGKETFILCRSEARREKERAMVDRVVKRIEESLVKMSTACAKRKKKPATGQLERRVGALLEANSRARGLFKVEIVEGEGGKVAVQWEKEEGKRQWVELTAGCYLLRSNISDWKAEDLWEAYVQLTQAEAAFQIQKSDLGIRPVWHQKSERVQGHILVCFLAYVVWKTLGQMCKAAGLGDQPRKVLDEISQIKMVDVVLPTREGVEIRKRCVSQPGKAQSVLLDRLRMRLPRQLRFHEM
jgi:transposase